MSVLSTKRCPTLRYRKIYCIEMTLKIWGKLVKQRNRMSKLQTLAAKLFPCLGRFLEAILPPLVFQGSFVFAFAKLYERVIKSHWRVWPLENICLLFNPNSEVTIEVTKAKKAYDFSCVVEAYVCMLGFDWHIISSLHPNLFSASLSLQNSA